MSVLKDNRVTDALMLGVDIGSTTAKTVLRRGKQILFSAYERHFSMPLEKLKELLSRMRDKAGGEPVAMSITGSAGLGIAESAGIPFVQEVFATGEVVRQMEPDTSCVIELGGEDAKIIFFGGGVDERMNGTCAGGTGAFIDQMATLLNVTVDELDELSMGYKRIYPIASRCGVFAKTDIQPLLNQGARKEDVAASIYQAVVNQTIAGLAQGRRIQGKVLFLGGPLHYCKGLRQRFTETLKLTEEQAVFPEYGRFAAALGASLYSEKSGAAAYTIDEQIEKLTDIRIVSDETKRLPPLFSSREEYEEFAERHRKAEVKEVDINSYRGRAWLGIDCGSTTTKLVLISENNEILYSYYTQNLGDPVEIIRGQLGKIYGICGERITICGSACTGYGEELIKNAFYVDSGIVETIAHYTAAKHFLPDLNFILDIGGQDIKCFRIKNGAIDSISLNEACSSGCGSFLETFAKAMGCSIAEFAQRGLFGEHPVNLGSRCTVFMNSSVKQAQRDGATVEDISAGLSISVVKNALYKVIRVSSAEELGENIVVQGGTFLNDAVLRAFERELGHNVIRPSIAGLMGAFGAALYSRRFTISSLIGADELKEFTHSAKSIVCNGCTNHCHLTVNDFGTGVRYISGNRCEKGLGISHDSDELPNLYEFKRNWLMSLKSGPGSRGKIGMPLGLGMYELIPLWHGIFTAMGFEVVISGMSTRRTYEKGQFSIPSDTACYPAKLVHGHIEQLLEQGVDVIFYPCLTYNIDEHRSDNHYNCPVVAYYPELLKGNVDGLKNAKFLYPYLDVNSPRQLTSELLRTLQPLYPDLKKSEVKRAVAAGREKYRAYMDEVKDRGLAALEYARRTGRRVMILAGRPYHIDAEIGHGIDKLANTLGFVVVSEDSVCDLMPQETVGVLNQWTYHARLYRAARYAATHRNTELVQLVSFGCGVDALTTDEVRAILEGSGKLYTQIKIDEMTNLGAVKIRLRSLMGALDERDEQDAKNA